MPKKGRGTTLPEAMYPAAPKELVALAKAWCADASDKMLGAIWGGYDSLLKESNLLEALKAATDDVERGLTRLLEPRIREQLSNDEPFYLQHGVPEDESRKPSPARPPEYDIAFIFRANPRVMWPLEAKVMKTPSDTADYEKTVKERYVACKYAPYAPEGAMVAYLVSGSAKEAFNEIRAALSGTYTVPPRWAARAHRVQSLKRRVPAGKGYPVRFRCHHLVMVFS